jgi:hypothetical protein
MGKKDSLTEMFGFHNEEEETQAPLEQPDVKVFRTSLFPEQTKPLPAKPVKLISLRNGLGWIVAACEAGVIIGIILYILALGVK